ncbi:uncharacterized protein LOC113558691 [Rhopalosiphum maidis]|uniref:uncharacterized protein LOC113558691 n=1 Tax=Rhopalosiphum maidis TaxID=43146 RepID=UPI000F000136|nr:uncharacterized protein LOC113558691 [Rhopalosiphum maidis]
MISKYMLLMGLISHNIVYSINMYFGRPFIPYYYSIPNNNVFQTLQDSFGTFNNFGNFYRKQNAQWNQGNRLSQLPEIVKRNNEDYTIHQSTFGDRQHEPRGKNLINHHLWNIHAQQALLQRHHLEKQKQYQQYLLKNQEEIKKQHDHQEKLTKEKTLKKKFAQRSKFLQRLYYDNLLHREFDENELEMHQKTSDET